MSTAKNINVEDIMVENVITISKYDTIRDAIELLLENGIAGAPVMEGDKVETVISETDLMKFAAAGAWDQKIESFLAKLSPLSKLIAVKRKDSFTDVFKQFLVNPVHRVIVIDDSGKLQGIVTQSIILKTFVQIEEMK